MADRKDEPLDLRALLSEHLDGTPAELPRHKVTEVLQAVLGIDSPAAIAPVPGIRSVKRGEPLHLADRYELQGELGRGGKGRVSLALDHNLGREVAVKTLLTPDDVTPAQVRRFVQEARITAQLDHPSVVPVYELGITPAGELYYTMRRVQGTSLARVLRGLRHRDRDVVERFGLGRLMRVFASLCLTVAYAHDRRVVHRDIKPENVMVGAYGEVLLMDWGFAAVIGDRESSGTDPRGLYGTPGYVAPERIRGKRSDDPRSDVYSLGCMLYELLTLQRVYEDRDARAVLESAVKRDPMPPSSRSSRGPVPEDLEDLCMACLSRRAEDRPPTARAVADEVDAHLEGSRRREQVSKRVKVGRKALQRHLKLREGTQRARELTAEIRHRIEAWRPLEEKAALLKGLRRTEEMRASANDAFTEALASFESALSLDRDDPDARSSMAEAYWLLFEEAELRNDRREMAALERWLLTYDDGRYSVRLRGEGAVTLDTAPTHAEVICQRYDSQDLLSTAVPFENFGRTPLRVVSLPVGSYLLLLRAPEHRVTRYPLRIQRRDHHHPDHTVRLLGLDEAPAGMVHVPGGAFVAGGDPGAPGALDARIEVADDFLIGRFPVTAREYLEFLQHVQQRDPVAARRHAPRESGLARTLWPRNEGVWRLPRKPRHGVTWRLEHPVCGVSHEDAAAYCAWRSERDGVAVRLPTELQWEKAARGVDGRFYPWGRWFDASLCCMQDSQPGPPLHRAVGSFPADTSPYGVSDLAGGVQEWCDGWFDEEAGQRPLRGGAWVLPSRHSRLAHRQGAFPWSAERATGFRIVMELPPAPAAPANDL